MKKLSLKERIYNYLKKHPEWIHGEDITKMAQGAGFEGETGRRRLRDLVEEGVVVTEPRPGKRTTSNWYRYKPQERVVTQAVRTETGVQLKEVTLFE